MTADSFFEPEISDAVREIERLVTAGENDALQHAWHIANAVERMLERYFPDLATANALDPQETVALLHQFYAAIHENTAHQSRPREEASAPKMDIA